MSKVYTGGDPAEFSNQCNCINCVKLRNSHEYPVRPQRKPRHSRRQHPKFNFTKCMDLEGTNYDVITSVGYLTEKYGLRKSHYIEKFIRCIHRKISVDVSKISDKYVDSLSPWIKSKLFLLLVTLSERGGPDYWLDKDEEERETEGEVKGEEGNGTTEFVSNSNGSTEPGDPPVTTKLESNNGGQDILTSTVNHTAPMEPSRVSPDPKGSTISTQNTITEGHDESVEPEEPKRTATLTELVIRQNINEDFSESKYDENYVFSSIWANFMEGLINHYLEKVIVPHSEMQVCQQLYKPMMKIISLYNEYNELMEKSERNGFLPSQNTEDGTEQTVVEKTDGVDSSTGTATEAPPTGDIGNTGSGNKTGDASRERLQRAQKLLWQARQDIPKTISRELTLLSEMYSTLSADEQDYELDEFVCCAEEYIELEFLPSLIDVLFKNCGSHIFWKVLLVLEPFFYYIEDVDELEDETSDAEGQYQRQFDGEGDPEELARQSFKPDPRVITLEKICEVAARQKWI